ncbi:MAG TPA: response regulator transcription factor, partial [Ferruginibacter sp.]|nr:response regulator transcription factor [Ferruginibacter sp.]
MAIKIAIFEDDDTLRESLVYLLSQANGYEVVGEYNNCVEAATLVRVYQPDVVLMDIDLPQQSGIQGVREVKEASPQTSVIMYTVFEDEEKLFQCLCAGANGYVLKKTAPVHLFSAIQEVVDGGAPMSPSIAKKVLNSFQRAKSNRYSLSPREVDVLQLLIKGYSTKMIAAELFMAYDTAR